MMKKVKPLNWVNVKDVPERYQVLVESILACTDSEYQLKNWFADRSCIHDLDEDFFLYNSVSESLKSEILKNKPIPFNAPQLRELLKLYKLRCDFQSTDDPKCTTDNPDLEMYIYNHPEWKQICKQAQLTLDLLQLPFPEPAMLTPMDADEIKNLINESPQDEHMTWGEFKKMMGIGEKDNQEKS